MKIVWSPLAEERLMHIIEKMRRERSGAGWRWLQRILAVIRKLPATSLRGFGVPELAGRSCIGQVYVDPCRIVYRIDESRIVILTIRSARKPLYHHERDGDHHGE
jgi:plasmid stabilization system protein ParE